MAPFQELRKYYDWVLESGLTVYEVFIAKKYDSINPWDSLIGGEIEKNQGNDASIVFIPNHNAPANAHDTYRVYPAPSKNPIQPKS